jgi:hypothetical protein
LFSNISIHHLFYLVIDIKMVHIRDLTLLTAFAVVAAANETLLQQQAGVVAAQPPNTNNPAFGGVESQNSNYPKYPNQGQPFGAAPRVTVRDIDLIQRDLEILASRDPNVQDAIGRIGGFLSSLVRRNTESIHFRDLEDDSHGLILRDSQGKDVINKIGGFLGGLVRRNAEGLEIRDYLDLDARELEEVMARDPSVKSMFSRIDDLFTGFARREEFDLETRSVEEIDIRELDLGLDELHSVIARSPEAAEVFENIAGYVFARAEPAGTTTSAPQFQASIPERLQASSPDNGMNMHLPGMNLKLGTLGTGSIAEQSQRIDTTTRFSSSTSQGPQLRTRSNLYAREADPEAADFDELYAREASLDAFLQNTTPLQRRNLYIRAALAEYDLDFDLLHARTTSHQYPYQQSVSKRDVEDNGFELMAREADAEAEAWAEAEALIYNEAQEKREAEPQPEPEAEPESEPEPEAAPEAAPEARPGIMTNIFNAGSSLLPNFGGASSTKKKRHTAEDPETFF